MMRLIARVIRLKVELHCASPLVSPDFRDGCLWMLQELQQEIEKRENERSLAMLTLGVKGGDKNGCL